MNRLWFWCSGAGKAGHGTKSTRLSELACQLSGAGAIESQLVPVCGINGRVIKASIYLAFIAYYA